MGLTASFVLLFSLTTRASAISKPRYSSVGSEVLKGRTATEMATVGGAGEVIADCLFRTTIPLIIRSSMIAIVMTVAIAQLNRIRLAALTAGCSGKVTTGAGVGARIISDGISDLGFTISAGTEIAGPFASFNSAMNRYPRV